MEYAIVWSAEAEATYNNILTFLEEHWSQKQVLRFVERTEQVIQFIKDNPKMYPRSKSKDIHRAVINRQISLYYYETGGIVVLLSFEDNRQSPDSLSF